ncbi:MAG: ASCH domain-containing protein [Gammaproteobacteria bacterium]|nr:ASCH domain-containing protein [Gammaproteobacteria bacterium]
MLFTKPFKERIRRGEQTLTFRRWRRPQAKPGGLYKLPPKGAIRVASVEVVEASDITDADARLAGHADRTEALAVLGGGDSPVYRVAFEYVAPEQVPAPKHLPADEIARRLRATDGRAKRPWTAATLALIAQNPERRAADLALALGFETAPFKANVRRLKALGLTESLEVGYRVTDLGQEVLQAFQPEAQ